MIQNELKKRNWAVLAYAVGMGLLIWRIKILGKEEDWISTLLLWWTAGAFIAACWFYLKAKKRTAGWLLLLIPASAIAPFVYWALQDSSGLPDNVACPKCGAANLPADTHCRLCHSDLAPLGEPAAAP